ncbi:DNA polymerase (family 10) [Deinococcus reticulitermitis]|uniref:DNA polymerase (Family 10) n=1 Tax=Deinococcus reticulitermitis TaxID=856736 RepID=A0A1H6UJH0_9DEIO|nr:DNA polymerase (family 10) [Deinococcus reticulitermitis]
MTLPPRKALVAALERTADLLDVLGEEAFRAQAYRGAARSLETLSAETPDLLERDFAGIPKVGKGIAAELSAFARTGVFAPLAAAEAQVPPGLLELLGVRGLGPKKLRALWQAGIDSPERLREAAQNGEVAALKGFGAKSAATLLAAVEFLLGARAYQHLSSGVSTVDTLLAHLAAFAPMSSGEVRRGLETVRCAEVTVTGEVDAVAARLAGVLDELETGEAEVSGTLGGVPVRVGVADETGRGALDLWLGGGDGYRAELSARATERGLNLSPSGLRRGGKRLTIPDEAAALGELGLPLRPAEYREPEHDGIWETLPPPEELVTVADLRGMLHTHSVWSDGTASIREMAEETLRLGHDFLGTGDHSRAAHYANGLSIERLREQLREVRELQRAGLPLVAGAEVDILEDGSLDYPDDLLAELDYVVASVHSAFTLDPARQTERLVRAASHPLVTILGHPTGRLLLRRPGYAFDLDAVLSACEQRGTVVEINANAYRLDLDWRDVLRWRTRLTFAVNTDAHTLGGLSDARYGVRMARKAGLTRGQVLNTLGKGELLAFIQRQRAARQAS